MGVTNALRRLRSVPGVLKARHLAEMAVTPHVRGDLAETRSVAARMDGQIGQLARELAELRRAVEDEREALARTQPAVLNAISSTNGITRQLQREVMRLSDAVTSMQIGVTSLWDELGDKALPRVDRLEAWVVEHSDDANRLIELFRTDLEPHVQSISWLLERIEVVRKEVLFELRFGDRAHRGSADAQVVEPRIVNPAAVVGEVRLNLGSGHLPLDGYANVDMREIPGVDVVASLDRLPFEPGTVTEIFSAHVLEHFPREALIRQYLPYWFGLLRPGGSFGAVVPDLESMTQAFARGDISFEDYREVVYGGQEYEGDTHFNGFVPSDLGKLLTGAGFVDVEVVATGRRNGICLEFEIRATKPESG